MTTFKSKYDVDDIFYEIHDFTSDRSFSLRVYSYRIKYISLELNEFKYHLSSPNTPDRDSMMKSEKELSEDIKSGKLFTNHKSAQKKFLQIAKNQAASISEFKGAYDKMKLKEKLQSNEIEAGLQLQQGIAHPLARIPLQAGGSGWGSPNGCSLWADGQMVVKAKEILIDASIKTAKGEQFVLYDPNTKQYKLGD